MDRRAALLSGLVLLAGCATPAGPSAALRSAAAASSTASSAPVQLVSTAGARFDIPAGWQTRPGSINPSGNRPLLFIGPGALPSDCVETATGGECHAWPDLHLVAGSAVFAWREHGMPGSRPPAGGDALTVGGRPAHILRGSADESCAAIGGDESIAVALQPAQGQDGWTGIDACLAGPDHASAEAAFQAMLDSVTW
jgi:hypothetical protein